jgi:hypothetical protein
MHGHVQYVGLGLWTGGGKVPTRSEEEGKEEAWEEAWEEGMRGRRYLFFVDGEKRIGQLTLC